MAQTIKTTVEVQVFLTILMLVTSKGDWVHAIIITTNMQ